MGEGGGGNLRIRLNNSYYEPGDEGFEKEVKCRVEAARKVIYGG